MCTFAAMKTKIVYCLTSDNRDFYYEQLLISLCSLRKHNPDASVTVVCDELTNELILKRRNSFQEFHAEVLQVDMPQAWDKKVKSRYIKTHLRQLISGDYLFIDTDTVICAPLDCVDDYTCEVGAVYDSHVLRRIPNVPQYGGEEWICGEAAKARMSIEGLLHFNSGVFYVKDNPLAYKLYERWAEIHEECLKHDVYCDQLPLMLANKELGEVITPIDPAMNCQAIWIEGVKILPEAKIVHYFPRQRKIMLASPWILSPIKEFDKIPSSIKWIINNPKKFFSQNSAIVFSSPSS